MSHDYERDSQSGAGNCRCGANEHHRRHPHQFLRVSARYAMGAILQAGTLDLCVCGLPPEADQHLVSVMPESSGSQTEGADQ